MTVYLMSKAVLERLEALQNIEDKRLTVTHAAELLGLSRSQLHRLLARYRADGVSSVTSRKRGRPSNRRAPTKICIAPPRRS